MEELPKSDQPEGNSEGKDPKFFVSPVAAGIIGLVGAFFLYQIVGGLLTLIVFGFDLEAAPVTGLRLMTIAGQVLFILLPALLFARFFYFDISRVIKLKLPSLKELLLFVLGLLILVPLLQNYLYIQNAIVDILAEKIALVDQIKSLLDSINKMLEKTYMNLLTARNIFEGFFVIIMIAVTPAICEEFMFRGFIQESFAFKLKPVIAIGITSIFFGMYHFNPYGILPLIALGFYFGYASYASGTILIPVILHFINNLFAVLAFFILDSSELIDPAAASPYDISISLVSFVFLFTLFAGVLFLIHRYYSAKNIE